MSPTVLKHGVFQAIADPTRRELLKLLVDKEEPIVSISEHFPISRTAVNKHLAILLDAGLVSRQRIGRETRYKSHMGPLIEVKEWLAYYEQFWDNKLNSLTNYVENENRTEKGALK